MIEKKYPDGFLIQCPWCNRAWDIGKYCCCPNCGVGDPKAVRHECPLCGNYLYLRRLPLFRCPKDGAIYEEVSYPREVRGQFPLPEPPHKFYGMHRDDYFLALAKWVEDFTKKAAGKNAQKA
jgi:hypothetical protein